MFVPATKEQIEHVTGVGHLSLMPSLLTGESKNRNVKHYVIFASNATNDPPQNIFEASVSTVNNLFMMEDLIADPTTVNTMGETGLHMFMGLLFRQVQKWANNRGKSIIIIKTKLPHCTEWFIEYGYSISYIDETGPEKGYRGMININRFRNLQ